jgi:WD40 repeat protein
MSLAYSPDGAFIAAGLDTGGVKLWDLSNRTDTVLGGYTGENSYVYNTIEIIKYSPDGKHIASFGENVIKIWDGKTGEEIGILEDPKVHKNVSRDDAVYWNNEKKRIICTGGGFMITWDINTGKIVDILKGEQFGMYFGFIIAVSPDGVHLVRSSFFKEHADILFWNIAENRQEGVFIGSNGIWTMNYSPDGNYILAGEQGAVIRLFDARSMAEVYSIKVLADYIYSLEFSPDGKYFISTLPDRIILFDTAAGKEISTFLNPNKGRFTNAVFSPDGRFIAIGLNHNIRIWNILNGEYTDIMASEKEEACEYEAKHAAQ